MIELPVNANVACLDSRSAGRSAGVVINPPTGRITYVIVKENQAPHALRLVPVEQVVASTPQTITLDCRTTDLASMAPFVETEFIKVKIPPYPEESYARPDSVPEAEMMAAQLESVPRSTIDPSNVVDEAAWESFPASDSPAWTSGRRS